ncbi:EAL domain-containing protein [Campylobacter sp.]|uniref:EAL domain-containing protein n=1 Tax=Campylobacter sp. TaxID=205 RepID=UPI003F9F12C4
MYIFVKKDDIDFDVNDIILITILVLCQVYFTAYKIYQSFQTSVLDQVTKAYNRDEILKLLLKQAFKFKGKSGGNMLILKIENLNDLNERYSFVSTDILLKRLVERLEKFLNEKVSKNTLIGRYSNEYFLIFCESKSTELIHLLNVFEKSILSDGIYNIELKIKFDAIDINHSASLKNSVSYLIQKLNESDNEDKVDITDDLEKDVCNCIDMQRFIFQTQLVKSLRFGQNLKNIIVKVYTDKQGLVSKAKVQNIANKNGYEVLFDINVIKKLSELKFKDEDPLVVEISSVSIRNLKFTNFIKEFVQLGKIDPNRVIFEFSEKLVYDEINRFREILTEYKNLGFRFALNKFGGNNAGFEYFKYLPIDFVIYDIEFNKNIKNDKFKTLLENLNLTAKRLGVKTIVRFVENEEFFNVAERYQTDFAQGFFIEKPKEI